MNPFFMYKIIISSIFIASLITFISCNSEIQTPQGEWIKGTPKEQIELIEEQFGGFGSSMVEVGYRYQELYWAIKDGNWGYADHQFEEIEEIIEHAVIRRPKREKTAKIFFDGEFAKMEEFLKKQDTTNFDQVYQNFTNGCNACHAMENHGFVTIKLPLQRQSPVR